MWTTPMFRTQFVPNDSPVLALLAQAVQAEHASFAASVSAEECAASGKTLSDKFFEAQLEADEPFLARKGSDTADAMAKLQQSFVSAAREFTRLSAGPDAAESLFARGPPRVSLWATLHEGCSSHATHVHPDAAVSGTFYLAMPPRAGAISFEDPRGMRPPFARNRLTHQPRAGELLLFPPWLSHGVACGGGGQARARPYLRHRSSPPDATQRACRRVRASRSRSTFSQHSRRRATGSCSPTRV